MGYGMKYTKGGFPFKASPAKQKENTTPHFLEKKRNPTVKAQKSKSIYNEKEEQTIENMSNAKDNNFDGHMEMGKDSPAPFKPKGMTGLTKQQKKNKRDKFSSDVKSFVTGKKKALELKQGEHNSKEFQAKVEKDIELRDEGRTLPQYTRKKR